MPGQFVDRREDVETLIDCWDTLVREALPWAASQGAPGRSGEVMGIGNVTWRKAGYSGDNGGGGVEVCMWRKSSYSGGNGGDCVEVASTASPSSPSVTPRT